MNKTLKIGYFYPDLLNLYGDNGNIEVLAYRARAYNFNVEVFTITPQVKEIPSDINFVFMGGGPDSSQKLMYEDLLNNKAVFLSDYVMSKKVGLFICGAYQLLGNYYKAADGSKLQGLGIFDLYTEHFGEDKPRCIGNTVSKISANLYNDDLFPKTVLEDNLVGFENHGGRTFLGKTCLPLAQIIKGFGNNATDHTEGAYLNSAFGTYFHGPLLSKNPHFADYLLFKALELTKEDVLNLPKINDTLIYTAHTASKKLKQ